MEVVVFGKHVAVSAGLREFTEQKIRRIEKYASDVRRVEVDFSEIPNPRVADSQICEILVHLKGQLVKAKSEATDHHAALDTALDKVEHQMRRLHDRRTKRPASRRDGGRGRAARVGAASAVPSEEDGERSRIESPAASGDRYSPPVIVKTKQFTVKPMVPEEAALQMEMLGHDFFLFTSASSGRAAVVYRRRDGNLGLIESA